MFRCSRDTTCPALELGPTAVDRGSAPLSRGWGTRTFRPSPHELGCFQAVGVSDAGSSRPSACSL